MLQTFDDLTAAARERGSARVAVACADDADVLAAVYGARAFGISAVLTGIRDRILRTAEETCVPIGDMEIIDCAGDAEACRTAAGLVASDRADLLMKGLVDTSVILRAVLDPENGLRTGSILSHAAFFRIGGYDRFIIVTDAAMNIAPDLGAKAAIIRNAAEAARGIGIENPKVAVVCAKEKVDPKMPATRDAEELVRMNARGEIPGCIVEGPLALDNAVSSEAAAHKGIAGIVAGNADILLMPDIEAGNILYKSLVYFARAEVAGIIAGARSPVVLTSRADSNLAKLRSIALAVVLSGRRQEMDAGKNRHGGSGIKMEDGRKV